MKVFPLPSDFSSNYQALNEEKREIRILYLHPSDDTQSVIKISMKPASLRDEVAYYALSYCWGTGKMTRQILNNGIQQYVTENLEVALRHLRRPYQDLCLWIDALCINQNDVEERNQQVQMMADIYMMANSVIVWLGDAKDDSDLGMDVIAKWAHAHPFEKCRTIDESLLHDLLRDKFDAREWRAVKKLFQRPYWTRTWIYQEISLGNDILVQCGQKVIPWSCMEGLYETNYQIQRKFELIQLSLPSKRFAVIESTLKIFDQILTLFMSFPAAQFQQALTFPMLQWTAELSCKDPRDRIYAILGLVKDADNYPKPNYSHSIRRVYTEFARSQIIQSQNLNILHEAACRYFPVHLSYETDTPIASWVPKWTVKPNNHIPSRQAYYKAASNIPIDVASMVGHDSDELEAQGIRVDKISRVASNYIGSFKIRDSLAFIENMNHASRYNDYRELKGYSHVYPTGEPLLFAFFRTCLLDIEFRFDTSRLNTEELLSMTVQTAEGFLIRLAYEYGLFDGSEMVTEQICDSEIPPFSLDFDFLPDELAGEYPHLTTFKKFKEAFQHQTTMTLLYQTLFERHMEHLAGSRVLFMTEKGYFGLSAISFPEPGDDIVVLFGCQTPVILRVETDIDPEGYSFISDCFVHGLMDGEAVNGVTAEKQQGQYRYTASTGTEEGRVIEKFIIR